MNTSARIAILLAGLLVGTSAPDRVEAGGLLGIEVQAPEAKDSKPKGKAPPAIELPASVKETPESMVRRVAAELAHEEHLRTLREVMQIDAAMDEMEGRGQRPATPRATSARAPRGSLRPR